MGSECKRLPVIDFSELKPATPEWETVKSQVVQHLQNGGFEAKFDEIPRSLGQAVVDGMKEMYDLPLDVKLRNKSSKPYGGYEKRSPDARLESLGIEHVNLPGKLEEFTNTLWPDGNPRFRDSFLSFTEKLYKMDRIIRRMVVEGLGLEKYMDDHLDSAEYLMRFQKYNATHSDEALLGLNSHRDHCYISILYQNEVRGLDIETKDGVWLTAEPSLTSCIVFAANSYHGWTNGRLHSSNHRVMLQGDEDRYSIGYFSCPKEGYMVTVPEELVDEDHPLLFKPFDIHKYIEQPDWLHLDSFKKYAGIQLTM